MGMTFSEVDVIAKLIPERLGINLGDAIKEESRIRELMETDPKISNLMDLAQKIEGLVRHAGIHAAGVIIADGNIVNHAPLYRGVEGENVVQYDMKHSEKIGLMKFDFLGLKTLTHINDALRLIERNRGKKYLVQDISLSDPGIYELMCKGDTAGVFQFEGEGITDLIRKAQPNCFEDIVAINALYRPGPMDMIPDYLSRKKGETPVKYLFPELEPILKETYGIIVYQEQVQLVASRIANYSLGEADLLRRAMGKKIAEEMAIQKDRFLAGAKENNHDLIKAAELFDTMAEFAKYGFNKSHAAAYCVVSAYTAWIKHYYPVEFFAARTLVTKKLIFFWL
jgi:DNA polymerase-3 subunit alpha